MMAKFKDAKDREWTIEMDYTTADEIKVTEAVDLIDPESLDQIYMKLSTNSRFVLAVAWAFCKAQAASDEADFKRHMKAQNVRDARTAIMEAIADFSPSPEMAEAMRQLFRAAGEKLPGAIQQGLNESLALTSDASVGSSPVLSAGPTLAP